MSWLQSVLGPLFFLPKSCQPGRFEYKKLVSSLSEDHQQEDCPICFTPINLNPQIPEPENISHHDSNLGTEEGSGNHALLTLPKIKHCYSTPCKHNFHQVCLSKWFETKPECPVCRKPLPYIE